MLTLTSPVDTWAHRFRAGAKLAALAVVTTGLFLIKTPLPLTIAVATTVVLYASCGAIFASAGLRLLRPLWPFILIVGLWHLWTGELAAGAAVLLRMIAAVALANFVTMTTRLSDMLDIFQRLARPLQVFGLSPRLIGLAVALVIRFIPVMLERVTLITQSWSARSVRRPRWRVLVPATLAALDDADRVAEALRARGGAG
jgi:biotin transport system permease protein